MELSLPAGRRTAGPSLDGWDAGGGPQIRKLLTTRSEKNDKNWRTYENLKRLHKSPS